MTTEPFPARTPAVPHADQQSISAARLAAARAAHPQRVSPAVIAALGQGGAEPPKLVTIVEEADGTKIQACYIADLKGFLLIVTSQLGALGTTFVYADV